MAARIELRGTRTILTITPGEREKRPPRGMTGAERVAALRQRRKIRQLCRECGITRLNYYATRCDICQRIDLLQRFWRRRGKRPPKGSLPKKPRRKGRRPACKS